VLAEGGPPRPEVESQQTKAKVEFGHGGLVRVRRGCRVLGTARCPLGQSIPGSSRPEWCDQGVWQTLSNYPMTQSGPSLRLGTPPGDPRAVRAVIAVQGGLAVGGRSRSPFGLVVSVIAVPHSGLHEGGALTRTRGVGPLRHSEPPVSLGLACRPVGACRRHLVKQLAGLADARAGPSSRLHPSPRFGPVGDHAAVAAPGDVTAAE
jgi:hypothetical protein